MRRTVRFWKERLSIQLHCGWARPHSFDKIDKKINKKHTNYMKFTFYPWRKERKKPKMDCTSAWTTVLSPWAWWIIINKKPCENLLVIHPPSLAEMIYDVAYANRWECRGFRPRPIVNVATTDRKKIEFHVRLGVKFQVSANVLTTSSGEPTWAARISE